MSNGRGSARPLTSKSRSKSKHRSASRETADDIKRRVQLQYNNYMEAKMAQAEDSEDPEISLLADSQATPPREVKKQLVL